MSMRDVLKKVGTEDFEDALQEELGENPDDLPLERACTAGGFPVEPEIVKIGNIEVDDENVECDIDIAFTEQRNSSCSDITVDDSRYVTCHVIIAKQSGVANFELAEGNDEPEF
jgi:hypothetical protein